MEENKERPKYNLWQNSGYMIALAWRKRKSVLVLCCAVVLSGVLINLTELFIAPEILRRVEAHAPLPELFMTILVFAGMLMILSALRAYVERNTIFGRIELRQELMRAVSRKFAVTSYPNTEDPAILTLMEKADRATESNSEATEAIWITLTNLLKDVSCFVLWLLLLSSLNGAVVAVVLAATVLGYAVSKRINEWGYRHREREASYTKKLHYVSRLSENMAYAKDIRIFGMRDWLAHVYRSTLGLYRAFIAKREKTYLWANVLDVLLSIVRNGFAYWYLIRSALQGGLSAAEFLLYFTAVSGFTGWVTGILSGFSKLHKQSLDISTLREFLELPEQFRFEGGALVKPEPGHAYEIRLDHVSFRYPGAEHDTLHDINLTVRPGEKLAVVGLNGAGKTTLVKLICGFYDPTEGQVLLDGKNIQTFDRMAYYRLFTAVFQNFSVLEVTLEENVAQTDTDIDVEKVKDALEKAGLTDRVNGLPRGLETHIGRRVFEDGVELSGGETQRLMLARALYKDAPILLLDEPTAALDPIAENDMYLKYNAMTEGRTSVFISHRLASTRFCDRILFLADGGIAEEGTHDTLMEKGGKYAALFRVQSKYYEEGADSDDEENR